MIERTAGQEGSYFPNILLTGYEALAGAGFTLWFTGVEDPYEVPENPEIVIETDRLSVEEGVDRF